MKLAIVGAIALSLMTLSNVNAQSFDSKARCVRGNCNGGGNQGGGRVDRNPRGDRNDRGTVNPGRGRNDRGTVNPGRGQPRNDRGGDNWGNPRNDRGDRWGGNPRNDRPRTPDVRPLPRRPDVRPAPRRPRVVVRNHTPRYRHTRDYVRVVPRTYVYHNRWVRWNDSRFDGVFWEDDYPYIGHRGYRYRYSPIEYCDYDLVDDYTNQVFDRFYGMTCQDAYDYCSDLRDDLNYSEPYGNRFFCAEVYSY